MSFEDLSPITQKVIRDSQGPQKELAIFLAPSENTPFAIKLRELKFQKTKFKVFEVTCKDPEKNNICQSENAPEDFPDVRFLVMQNIEFISSSATNPDFSTSALTENQLGQELHSLKGKLNKSKEIQVTPLLDDPGLPEEVPMQKEQDGSTIIEESPLPDDLTDRPEVVSSEEVKDRGKIDLKDRTLTFLARPTSRIIPGHKEEKHHHVEFKDGLKKYEYIITDKDFEFLTKGKPTDVKFKKAILFDDGFFPQELASEKAEAPTNILRRCLEIIKLFFQEKIDLKDKKWQRFLKDHADLTLHRVAWGFLKSGNEKGPLEDKIISLLKKKMDPKNKDIREKFDALLTMNKKSRNFIQKSLSLMREIIIEQSGNKREEEQPFLLSSSDLTMLEILAQNEELLTEEEGGGFNHRFLPKEKSEKQSILNLTTLVNSGYLHSKSALKDEEHKIKNMAYLKNYLESLSNKFKNNIQNIVETKCVDDLDLVCKLQKEKTSIVDDLMQDYSQIKNWALEGLLMRSDTQNSLKYNDLWLKVAK